MEGKGYVYAFKYHATMISFAYIVLCSFCRLVCSYFACDMQTKVEASRGCFNRIP